MDISLFDYKLPPELIAQTPSRRRDQSRLMVVDRAAGNVTHRRFRDILEYVHAGDCLVVNNTKVFKARLWGHRKSGGRVEVFLVRKESERGGEIWEALVSPTRRLNEGEMIIFEGAGEIRLLELIGGGSWRVEFASVTERRRLVSKCGHVPLPHYIDRPDQEDDIRRYQTLFARSERIGAVAAPTAGFHFTRSILKQLGDLGVSIAEVTLHVGPGTFKPVKCENINDHVVDREFAELSVLAAKQVNGARAHGRSVIAVGTTSMRTLESAAVERDTLLPFSRMVDTYIRPGYNFRAVDTMVTNFHLPKSSLLILVSAFAGRELILDAYHEAIRSGYRFYSYGDAMLIL